MRRDLQSPSVTSSLLQHLVWASEQCKTGLKGISAHNYFSGIQCMLCLPTGIHRGGNLAIHGFMSVCSFIWPLHAIS